MTVSPILGRSISPPGVDDDVVDDEQRDTAAEVQTITCSVTKLRHDRERCSFIVG